MTRCVLALVLAAILVVSPGLSPAALANSATDYIRVRIERIYDLLGSAGSAATPDRMAAARATLDEMFDWAEMGKQTLGQYWQERSPAERAEFVQLFATLFQRTYLSRIEVADRERFQYLGETSDGDAAIVKTVVVTQKGAQIPVDYVARRAGDPVEGP
jgi:phospholipid transport system substrate-binding protein